MNLTLDSNPQVTPTTSSANVCWYAARTAPCREKRVFEHLTARNIESFLPLYRTRVRWKNGCKVELERPLFPGYIFVRMAGAERVRVLSVPSVVSIVSRGRLPEPLDDEALMILRTDLRLQNAEPHPYLAVGERVAICAGAFTGLSGVILRKKSGLRVVLTLDVLMQSIAVEVNDEDLEPVQKLASARPAR